MIVRDYVCQFYCLAACTHSYLFLSLLSLSSHHSSYCLLYTHKKVPYLGKINGMDETGSHHGGYTSAKKGLNGFSDWHAVLGISLQQQGVCEGG